MGRGPGKCGAGGVLAGGLRLVSSAVKEAGPRRRPLRLGDLRAALRSCWRNWRRWCRRPASTWCATTGCWRRMRPTGRRSCQGRKSRWRRRLDARVWVSQPPPSGGTDWPGRYFSPGCSNLTSPNAPPVGAVCRSLPPLLTAALSVDTWKGSACRRGPRRSRLHPRPPPQQEFDLAVAASRT